MVKFAIIFEGIEQERKKNGAFTNRKRLKGRHVIIGRNGDFWERVDNTLNELYDLDKVKKIYVLGDGATWIKNGAPDLKQSHIYTRFAIDRFHFLHSINFITADEDYRKLLYSHAHHNDKADFNKLVDHIIELDESRRENIEKRPSNILNNWNNFQIMINEVKTVTQPNRLFLISSPLCLPVFLKLTL